jgi:3',5'-cyclic AMP phosphodiesterase CpdA
VLIAHISDLHLLSLQGVHPLAFLGKRATGGVNLLFNRGGEFPKEVAASLIQDINARAVDHLILSGDLTNLAFPGEFELVKSYLNRLRLPPREVTVVPGNHDYYTKESARLDHFSHVMAPFLEGDLQPGPRPFPLLRLRGELAVLALSTARPSMPLLAVGTLGRRQIRLAEELLADKQARERFRLVVMHHPPCGSHAGWHARLTDAAAFRNMIRRVGADLVVHGHLHRSIREEIAGPNGRVPVLGVASGTWLSPRDPHRRAQYHVYHIEEGALRRIETRCYSSRHGRFE